MSTALITGAGKRLGAALARHLAAEGHGVVIHYGGAAAEAEALRAEITKAGGRAFTAQADLSNRDEVDGLMAKARAAAGVAIDVLVNSASVFAFDDLAGVSWDSWDKHMGVNLAAPLMLSRDFAAQTDMTKGVIINIIDQKVNNPNPDFLSYTVSKFGLKALTELLAMQLAPKIRVCGIAPGLTLPSGQQTQADFERAARSTPLGLTSTPSDIAHTASFILNTPSITGHIITVDGGESLLGRARDVYFDLQEKSGGKK
jgi:NAD(P)-dependent dehydrogenase (short-subunit alcohol dehydrogenase family)